MRDIRDNLARTAGFYWGLRGAWVSAMASLAFWCAITWGLVVAAAALRDALGRG